MARLKLTTAHRKWGAKLGLAAAVALLVVVVTQEDILKLGIIQRLELASIDYRFESRGTNPAFKDTGTVVIVEISEESFKSLPEKWPWPRSYYAHLIRNLKRAGAKVVGVDIILSGHDVYSPANDDDLRAAIRETGIVVLAGKAPEMNEMHRKVIANEDYGNIFFHVDSCIGATNIYNDADGVYRRYCPLWGTNTDLLIPAFGFAVLNKYFDYQALNIVENFSDEFIFGGVSIPKYDSENFLINFFGPSGTFRRIRFADVIDDESFRTIEEDSSRGETNTFSDPEYGYLYDGTFKDKIVLVGSTVPEDHDLFPISFARGQKTGDNLMYGVEIHSNVIESVIRQEFIRKQSAATEIMLIFLLTIVTFLVTSGLKSSKTRHHFLVELNGFLFAMSEIFLVGFVALLMFNKDNYLVTVISPMLAVLAGYVSSTVYHFVVERKQRMLIKTMFSTYVNPSVVDELIMNPEKLTLGGQRKELSVMFTDIDGFTTISEQMDSQALVSLLNEYLSEMTEIVFRNDGTLDKFEGDAIVAFWGAPIAQEDHSMRACRCALEMQDALVEIRKKWKEQNKPLLNIRIGVNTGEMVVGNMGGMGKFDYTVIGDSVNLASRLEGANKLYRTGIMVSQRTFDLVKHAIIGRELDLIMVKGRSEPLKTYELLMLSNGKVPADLHRFLEAYAMGLQFYRERKWGDARKKFKEALLYRPSDYPSQMYVERATDYAIHPPPEDWNGVLVMTTK